MNDPSQADITRSLCCLFCLLLLLLLLLFVVVVVVVVVAALLLSKPPPRHPPTFFADTSKQATVGDLPLMQMTQAFDDTTHVEHHVLQMSNGFFPASGKYVASGFSDHFLHPRASQFLYV